MESESMVLLKLSSMNFVLWMSKEMIWKVKIVLLEVSLIKFVAGRYNEIIWKVKAWCYSNYHI